MRTKTTGSAFLSAALACCTAIAAAHAGDGVANGDTSGKKIAFIVIPLFHGTDRQAAHEGALHDEEQRH